MFRKTANIVIAFIIFVLLLIPFMRLFPSQINADSTQGQIEEFNSGDYVFFIVEENEVPLSAIPEDKSSAFLLWIVLLTLATFGVFAYSSWYLSLRRNLWELSGKLSPMKRKALKVPNGYFHPVRSYRLCKEAEHDVASVYSELFF